MVGSGCLVGLIGNRGTGKTQLAIEAIRESIRRWMAATPIDHDTPHIGLYTTAMGMYLDIRATYKTEGKTEREIIESFVAPRLLVIDEIQERGESDWEDRVLVHICDRRYADLKDTVLVGNVKEKALAEGVGSSIVSRMQECGKIIICDWDSFRNPRP